MRVAVLIPVYADQLGLDASLKSLAQETYPFTVFVVDDGSPKPISVPERLSNGAEVRLVRLSANGGIERALNAGLEEIWGGGFEYVARLDAGDESMPGRLELQVSFLDEHQGHAIVGTAAAFVDPTGRVLFIQRGGYDARAVRRAMHLNNVFCHPTVMLRASTLAEVGPYSLGYPAAEDYELFFRLLCRFDGAVLEPVTVRTLASPTGLSRARRMDQLRSRCRVQRRYFDPGEPASYMGLLKTSLLRFVPWSWIDHLKSATYRPDGEALR